MPERPVYSSPCSRADTDPAYHDFLTVSAVEVDFRTMGLDRL